MEDPVEMTKNDVKNTSSSSPHGWKAHVLAFYQKLFKSGGDAATKAHMKDDAHKKPKAATGVSNLRSAGEIARENTIETSEISHTVVDLPSVEPSKEVTPSAITTEPPKQDQGVIPVPEQPQLCKSANSVEPTTDQSKNTLVIKNLPFKFKLSDLEKLLSEHQAKPKNVRLLRDDSGKFTGMAFIRCASKEDAQRLINSMHGLDISGRNIQVEFKTKKQKKKSKLGQSTDSLSSSSDELPGNRLRLSSEGLADRLSTVTIASMTAPPTQPVKAVPAPPPIQPQQKSNVSKLSVSAEHNFENTKQAQFPNRRKSLAVESSSNYSHSRVHRDWNVPSIRPVRQPVGPDGKTNGFSEEYRRGRTWK